MEFGLTFQKQLGINRSQLTNSMIFQRGRLKPPTRLKMLFIFLIYDISHSSVRGVIRTLICSRMCHFVLAGPCELQLHTCKEFDQIPFSKCLKPGFWAILFWYMHALLINVFFLERFHPKASLCNCRPVAWKSVSSGPAAIVTAAHLS